MAVRFAVNRTSCLAPPPFTRSHNPPLSLPIINSPPTFTRSHPLPVIHSLLKRSSIRSNVYFDPKCITCELYNFKLDSKSETSEDGNEQLGSDHRSKIAMAVRFAVNQTSCLCLGPPPFIRSHNHPLSLPIIKSPPTFTRSPIVHSPFLKREDNFVTLYYNFII
ncbi:dynamin-1 [Striga asiatica]|uniref:Dynamin-1 n=1 Tax=Striga asiatica TaxID=4170 RepID=A0A5A7P9J0_STRAF|nr:dynamin-1 [Striga asiatica]